MVTPFDKTVIENKWERGLNGEIHSFQIIILWSRSDLSRSILDLTRIESFLLYL